MGWYLLGYVGTNSIKLWGGGDSPPQQDQIANVLFLRLASRLLFFFLAVPTIAPALSQIARVSATEIQISWNATGEVVDTYFVKYRPVEGIRHKRSMEEAAVVVETNQTDYNILGLDPGISYAVSVAAENKAGRGNFSMEVTVGCEIM